MHPMRLRIVKTFLGDRALTTAQIAAELDDIPMGSLYRHIAMLTKGGVLQVVAERRVRGTAERTLCTAPVSGADADRRDRDYVPG